MRENAPRKKQKSPIFIKFEDSPVDGFVLANLPSRVGEFSAYLKKLRFSGIFL